MPAVAAGSVLLFAGGVFVMIIGWRGRPVAEVQPVSTGPTIARHQQIRLAGSLGLGLVAWLVSGWLGLFVAVPAVAYSLSGLFYDRRRREQKLQRLRAVAAWLEMMRDTIVAGAGVSSAVQMTARRAPDEISGELRRLSASLESSSFSTAIAQFGDELDLPEADGAITALAMASRSAGGNLGKLLTLVVESIRRRVEQTSRIEALRVRFLTSASLMVAVTIGTSALVLLAASQLREPYDSALGQLTLISIGGFYALSIYILRKMGDEQSNVRFIVETQA